MSKNKYYRSLIFLFVALSQSAISNELSDKINSGIELMKEVDRNIEYSRILIKESANSTKINKDESIFITNNTDYNITDYFAHNKNGEIGSSLKLINNGIVKTGVGFFPVGVGYEYNNLIFIG